MYCSECVRYCDLCGYYVCLACCEPHSCFDEDVDWSSESSTDSYADTDPDSDGEVQQELKTADEEAVAKLNLDDEPRDKNEQKTHRENLVE